MKFLRIICLITALSLSASLEAMLRMPQTAQRSKQLTSMAMPQGSMRSISTQTLHSSTVPVQTAASKKEPVQQMRPLQNKAVINSSLTDADPEARSKFSLRMLLTTLGLSGLAGYLMTDEAKAEGVRVYAQDPAREDMQRSYDMTLAYLKEHNSPRTVLLENLKKEAFVPRMCFRNAKTYRDGRACIIKIGEIMAACDYIKNDKEDAIELELRKERLEEQLEEMMETIKEEEIIRQYNAGFWWNFRTPKKPWWQVLDKYDYPQ